MPPPPPQPPPPPPPTTPFFTTILNQSPASAAPNTSANTNVNTSAGANANANAAMPSPPRAPTAQPPVNAITSTQRSAQARNKPFGAGSGSGSGIGSGSVGGIDTAAMKREESYEERQRRAKAAEILSSVEMLIWWAGVRCEVCSWACLLSPILFLPWYCCLVAYTPPLLLEYTDKQSSKPCKLC